MAEIKTILCAVDFSDNTPRTADFARTLAKSLGARVVVLYAAPSMSQYVGFHVPPNSIETFVSEIVKGAEDAMTRFLEEEFAGIEVVGRVAAGYPVDEILKYAKDEKADLIVMGTHGRKGVDRIIFGSTAEKIIKSSPIPVLTVRPGA